MALTGLSLERYSRNILLRELGVAGQKKLLTSRVLVLGAGGLGSPAALYLAAAGVGALGLADGDKVELSNLQRQLLHGVGDIGRLKVESGRESLLALNPELEVKVYPERARADNILNLIAGYDFVIDGTDNLASKFLINDACVFLGKPLAHAGVIRFQGQLTTYLPGQGPCYRCLFEAPPPPGGEPTCGQEGVLGAVAGVIGSLMALEAIKALTGLGSPLSGRLLVFDGLGLGFREVNFPRRADCAACGSEPVFPSSWGGLRAGQVGPSEV
ncbi:MAG: HesA/MoeB/ThiF family protein [Deltaproteobacteria bacterium]|jgi:molybdopterin/thiamine biosynthesis adenylyltransferase|nr:HesA/MoeB/ThiF family protein [Deltaproteobacteria bacterium]